MGPVIYREIGKNLGGSIENSCLVFFIIMLLSVPPTLSNPNPFSSGKDLNQLSEDFFKLAKVVEIESNLENNLTEKIVTATNEAGKNFSLIAALVAESAGEPVDCNKISSPFSETKISLAIASYKLKELALANSGQPILVTKNEIDRLFSRSNLLLQKIERNLGCSRTREIPQQTLDRKSGSGTSLEQELAQTTEIFSKQMTLARTEAVGQTLPPIAEQARRSKDPYNEDDQESESDGPTIYDTDLESLPRNQRDKKKETDPTILACDPKQEEQGCEETGSDDPIEKNEEEDNEAPSEKSKKAPAIEGEIENEPNDPEVAIPDYDEATDDIVARQIREAAMEEKDPELSKKLWLEYERYKESL